MRISTNQFYLRGLDNIFKQQAEVARYQRQVSSGKKIESSADDPVAAAKINLMQQRVIAAEQLQNNKDGAEAIVRLQEGVLGKVVGVLQNLRVLQVDAGKPSTESSRQALANQMRALRNQLFDLANSQDQGGNNFMFSGSKTATQPFSINASNQYIYNGDDTVRKQMIGTMMDIEISESGADVFMRIPNGNGSFSVQQTAVPNTGSAIASSGSLSNSSAFVLDDYTIQFALNSSNQLVYMISGAASGAIDPATGNPDDATLYQDGATITFNGATLTISGAPNPGDAFLVKPAENESIFSTVGRMISNLQQPDRTAADKAAIATENNQLLEQIDSAIGNILNYQAKSGAHLNQLELVESINEDLILTSKSTLSQLEDVDLADAMVKLNMQIVNLQAAQQSFVRIQNLSAFNYM